MTVVVLVLFVFIYLAIIGITIAGIWGTLEKAGEPGWAAIVPVYNFMVLARVAGKGETFGLLMFIPIVNLVIYAMILGGLCERFGKSQGYVVGLFFLPFIFYPMLGFGNDRASGVRRPRSRYDNRDDYDRPRRPRDEEDYDRPRRRRAIEDEEDDLPPPRSRLGSADEHIVEGRPAPPARPRYDEDDEDYDPPPRRRPPR